MFKVVYMLCVPCSMFSSGGYSTSCKECSAAAAALDADALEATEAATVGVDALTVLPFPSHDAERPTDGGQWVEVGMVSIGRRIQQKGNDMKNK